MQEMQETQVQSLWREDPREAGTVTRSSIAAWWIPWTRSLEVYGPWGHRESDASEQVSPDTVHLPLSEHPTQVRAPFAPPRHLRWVL